MEVLPFPTHEGEIPIVLQNFGQRSYSKVQVALVARLVLKDLWTFLLLLSHNPESRDVGISSG